MPTPHPTHQGHQARKRFGQNFLHDQNVIARIVATIRPHPDDRMVEIGPGLAALTRPLLETVQHLDVVELDRDLAARLRSNFAPERLTVHEADALKFDFGSLLGERANLPFLAEKLRVVGNLPYNISSPLLFHLASFADTIRDLHFMLQKEVVERMAAAPDSADYGRLSVMLQARFQVEKCFIVGPGAFTPPPKVDSAIVRLTPLPTLQIAWLDSTSYGQISHEAAFARVVASAFGQRRKTLRNTLKDILDATRIEAAGIDPGARAETLSVADFARLARQFVQLNPELPHL